MSVKFSLRRLPLVSGIAFAGLLVSPCVLADSAWGEYAVGRMTPAFDWAAPDAPAPAALDIRARHEAMFTESVKIAIAERTRLNFSSNPLGLGATGAGQLEVGSNLIGRSDGELQRRLWAASLEQNFGDNSRLSAGVVLAYQSFASNSLGVRSGGLGLWSEPLRALGNSSHGTGVRLALTQPLRDGLWLDASLQSRIDMDAMVNYRGVFAEAGDFDLPAVGSVALGLAASDSQQLSFAVSRIGFSDVAAFTSNRLPTRLLALLGDGGSPDFRWRDLTVYSLDWRWQASPEDAVTLRYTTRQQPDTTSALLTEALGPERDGYSLGLGYVRQLNGGSQWRFGASWSPVSYLQGHNLRLNRDIQGASFEVESIWTKAF